MNESRVKSKRCSMRMYEEEARKQVVDINLSCLEQEDTDLKYFVSAKW